MFFCKIAIFKLGILTFSQGLSRCTAWVGGKCIGEVIFPFQNSYTTKNGSTVYPPKKPILFLKKRPIELEVSGFWNSIIQFGTEGSPFQVGATSMWALPV